MKLTGKENPVWKVDAQVAELESSLETVKVMLEQQSPTVGEAQHLLKVSLRPRVIPHPLTFFSFFFLSLSKCGMSWMRGTAA